MKVIGYMLDNRGSNPARGGNFSLRLPGVESSF
jgi:hypothetical protein